MQISAYWFWKVPKKVSEPIVVIDAWTATTNLSIILAKKPKRLVIVNEENFKEALRIYSHSILVGESQVLPESSFEISNFPCDLIKADLTGKTVVYMTINGTRVFEKFCERGMVIGAAFNNLKAVVGFLKNKEKFTFVMAGSYPDEVLEDEICNDVLKYELGGKEYDWEKLQNQAKNFIRNYYAYPKKQEESFPQVFERLVYNIIPSCQKNKEGFLEIKNLLS